MTLIDDYHQYDEPPPQDAIHYDPDDWGGMSIEEFYERCAIDRIWFYENVLHFTPDAWQREVSEDLDRGESRISVRSGHGVGKTALCATTMLHFLLFRDGGVKVVCTSPSGAQLFDGLFAECVLWINRLPDFLRSRLDVKAKRILDVESPENRWISFRTSRIEQPEALAGIHAENVLLVVDEASGVPQPVFEAGSGTMSTLGAICLMISNPTRTSGFFFNSQKPTSRWRKYHVSCLDSPRVSDAFVEDIRSNFGEGSAQWSVRVLGEFATVDEDVILPRELVESAIGRDIYPSGDYIWGVDVGRGGDPSALCIRQGRHVRGLQEFHLRDTMALTRKIYAQWEILPENERPTSVCVDVIGLGAGVADRLRELGLPVVDINVSETPAMKDKYPRLRDELWWKAREWFETRSVTIPDTPLGREFVEELVAPLQIITATGKNGAESKQDMKRRGLPSPNMADAFIMSLALEGAIADGHRVHGGWSKPLRRNLQSIA